MSEEPVQDRPHVLDYQRQDPDRLPLSPLGRGSQVAGAIAVAAVMAVPAAEALGAGGGYDWRAGPILFALAASLVALITGALSHMHRGSHECGSRFGLAVGIILPIVVVMVEATR